MHSLAATIVAEALALRRSHPLAPAMDVLELVMKGRCVLTLDFGRDALPPADFALMVAEAFDGGMTTGEWLAWTGPNSDPRLHAALLEVWQAEVWPRFTARFEKMG